MDSVIHIENNTSIFVDKCVRNCSEITCDKYAV